MSLAKSTSFMAADTGSPSFLSFDCSTLMQLIEAVRREYPDQSLLFVVDYSTIAYYPDAEAQFIKASEKSGALVIASVLEF